MAKSKTAPVPAPITTSSGQELTFSLTIGNSSVATSHDKDGAFGVVEQENAKRTAYNENPDGSDPPPPDQDAGDGTWTMLPVSPPLTLLESYEWCYDYRIIPSAHSSYASQYAAKQANESEVKQKWEWSTDEQRAAAEAELAQVPPG